MSLQSPDIIEHELQEMAFALLEANDRLVALHQLATTEVPSLDPAEIRQTIAGETLRLTGAASVAITGDDHAPATAGSYQARAHLTGLAQRYRGPGPDIVRAGTGTEAVDIALAAVGDPCEGVVAVAAHRGHHVDPHTLEIVDAIALRLRAQIRLAKIHATAMAAAAAQQMEDTVIAIMASLPHGLPSVPGITIAGSVDDQRAGAASYLTGARSGTHATYCLGLGSADDVGSATALVAAAARLDQLVRSDPAGEPSALVRTVIDAPGPRNGDAANPHDVGAIRWDVHRACVTIAHTPGLHVFVRSAGRTELRHLDAATSTDLRLDPADAVFVCAPTFFEQRCALGRQLDPATVATALDQAPHHSAAQLLDRVSALRSRHAGEITPVTGCGALVLVREQTS